MSINPTYGPRQERDPRYAELLQEKPLRSIPQRPPFIATDPPELADALVETASGIFALIRRDDLPADVAALIDDWRMDYALRYIPGRLGGWPGRTESRWTGTKIEEVPPHMPPRTNDHEVFMAMQRGRVALEALAPEGEPQQKVPNWLLISLMVLVGAFVVAFCALVAA